MKKYLILAALAMISTGAIANERGNHMNRLTEQQRACVEDYGCPRPDRKHASREEMKHARECHERVMKSCGIEIPEEKRSGWFRGRNKS